MGLPAPVPSLAVNLRHLRKPVVLPPMEPSAVDASSQRWITPSSRCRRRLLPECRSDTQGP
eukprot:6599020-Prymnesium_polylepis.1